MSSRSALQLCGVLSSLVYIAANVVGAIVWRDYSSYSQTISELSAIGAPSRSAWLPFGIAYDVLVVAFGIGVWRSARDRRSMRVTGAMLIAIGAIGAFWPPMHMRGQLGTLTDTLHVVWASVVSVMIMLAVGFGAAALGKWFRRYSIATIVAMLLFGTGTFLYAPAVGANLPTPGLGVIERANLGAYLLWVCVLAVTLMREDSHEREWSLLSAARSD